MLPANVRIDWKFIAWYKHSSLFGLIICNEVFYNTYTRCQRHKTFFAVECFNQCNGPSVVKLFLPVTYEFIKKLEFVPGRLPQPSLLFAGKAEAYPSESSVRFSTLGWTPGLTHKHLARLEKLDGKNTLAYYKSL